MRYDPRNARGALRGAAAAVLVVLACALMAAPAAAQDDGYGAYVGASTTVAADDTAVASQRTTLSGPRAGGPTAADPSASALPQRLPFTGDDVTQIAVIGAFVVLAGVAVLGWRRRAATA